MNQPNPAFVPALATVYLLRILSHASLAAAAVVLVVTTILALLTPLHPAATLFGLAPTVAAVVFTYFAANIEEQLADVEETSAKNQSARP